MLSDFLNSFRVKPPTRRIGPAKFVLDGCFPYQERPAYHTRGRLAHVRLSYYL